MGQLGCGYHVLLGADDIFALLSQQNHGAPQSWISSTHSCVHLG